jgi:hypothetical protein
VRIKIRSSSVGIFKYKEDLYSTRGITMRMTVGQLISILSDYPEDAQVKLMTQENYPFENTIKGVIGRDQFETIDEGDHSSRRGEKKQNDVFLLEGTQLCYGSHDAFREF